MSYQDFQDQLKRQTSKNIAVDFDGVIHKNSRGFYDGTIYDDPVKDTELFLSMLSEEYNIIIYTCKARPDRPLIEGKTGKELIWEWLEKHGLAKYVHDVTHEKPRAMLYIDDKGLCFESWEKVWEFIQNKK